MPGRAEGGLTDDESADGRGTLQPRGRVDDISGDDPLPLFGTSAKRDHRLARVHGDTDVDLEVLHRLENAKTGPNRPLGIVFVCERRAEDSQHCVADELLERAAEALDLLFDTGVVGPQAGADVLRVSLVGAGRVSDEVGEEDGDDLALLCRGGWSLGK